jgi:hypothetical protein
VPTRSGSSTTRIPGWGPPRKGWRAARIDVNSRARQAPTLTRSPLERVAPSCQVDGLLMIVHCDLEAVVIGVLCPTPSSHGAVEQLTDTATRSDQSRSQSRSEAICVVAVSPPSLMLLAKLRLGFIAMLAIMRSWVQTSSAARAPRGPGTAGDKSRMDHVHEFHDVLGPNRTR